MFCATQDHALAVRDLINQMKTSNDPNYCVRVTANDGELGEQFLRTFQDNEKTIPTILTTSQKLSTGVDARNVRNIVLMRPIGTMIEFKQIIGRGTRLFDGKDYFTIYDFVKAYEHFNDPEWDGEPVEPEPVKHGERENGDRFDETAMTTTSPSRPSRPQEDQDQARRRQGAHHPAHDGDDLLEPGRQADVRRSDLSKRLFGELPQLFKDEDELRRLWSSPTPARHSLESLAEKGFGPEQLAEISRMINAEKSDLFDVLAYIAFALAPITRSFQFSLLGSSSLRPRIADLHAARQNTRTGRSQMFEQTFKNIDDVLWKEAGCTTELDYTEQTSWILFLKYLDDLEQANGRWRPSWSGKTLQLQSSTRSTAGRPGPRRRSAMVVRPRQGPDRRRPDRLRESRAVPLSARLQDSAPPAPTRSNTRSARFSARSKTSSRAAIRCAMPLELVDELRFRSQKEKHELSHLYEAKIKNMGNAGRNGGEYYTPRPLIRAMIQVIKPKIGERIYDGALRLGGLSRARPTSICRTKGELTTSDSSRRSRRRRSTARRRRASPTSSAIMNMILHGIEAPNIVHTNTLSENLTDIQEKDRYDVILANPPFGGKEREGGAAELPDQDRRDRVSVPPALHQDAEGRRPRGHRHQEHVPVELRQRLDRAAQGAAGELQPAHRARTARAGRSRARA